MKQRHKRRIYWHGQPLIWGEVHRENLCFGRGAPRSVPSPQAHKQAKRPPVPCTPSSPSWGTTRPGLPAERNLQGLTFSDVLLDECVSANQPVGVNELNSTDLNRRRLQLCLQVQFTLVCFTWWWLFTLAIYEDGWLYLYFLELTEHFGQLNLFLTAP